MGRKEVLLSLHHSAAHNEQLEAWQTDRKAFEDLKDDYEGELRRVRNEAYQIITLYALFQSVILTAVSQTNLLTCSLSWCPASLSVVASVAAIFAIADKLNCIGEVQEDIRETSDKISAILECQDKVEQQGADLDLEIVRPRVERRRAEHPGYSYIKSRDGVSALLFLTTFATLITYFYINTLCRHCSRCVPTK